MIHPTALVESDRIGESTNIWAYAHVMEGARVGKNCNIGDHAFVENGAVIGDNVTIKNQVCIWEGVTIEDSVFVGPNVTFTNDRTPRSPRMPSSASRYLTRTWLESTRVGYGASIGAAATICPGVELGEFCMVAAGAVVTKDVPSFALVAGVPAKKIADVCVCGNRLLDMQRQKQCENCGMEFDEWLAASTATKASK